MALKTDITSNECYDFSTIIENGQLVLLDQPLMFCSSDSGQNNCSIALEKGSTKNHFNQNLNFPDIVFNRNYFEIKDAYMHEEHRIDDGLEVLEILCNGNVSSGQPEFIDVNELTEIKTNSNIVQDNNIISVSDDDDVVFVKEYKEIEERNLDSPIQDIIKRNSDNNVRRNPVRSVRTKSRDLSKELLFEEDFAFLDVTSEDEDEKDDKVFKSSVDCPSGALKQWPINAHERPEYNSVTNKIDSFDYTIRNIQKILPNKNTKVGKVTIRRKQKKKYLSRRRKPRAVVPKKCYLDELKTIVDSATEMLREFFSSSKDSRELINSQTDVCSSENKLEILKNQAVLFSLVNNIDQSEIMGKFKNFHVIDESQE